MALNLKSRNFLTLLDFTPEEIRLMLDVSHEYKRLKRAGISHKIHEGKQVALLFEKTSTRTRTAFTVAARDLGIHPEFLGKDDIQMGKKESIKDTAIVLGRSFDGRNNMANSLMIGSAKMGVDFRIAAPNGLHPDPTLVEKCREIARETGAKITITDDLYGAAHGADFIYTDVWVSMGEEDKFEERIHQLRGFQVNTALLHATGNPNVKFMHCLPAFHDLNTKIGKEIFEKYGLKEMEVTDEVFNSNASIVFDEAENRMHTIKAVMALTL